MHRYLLQAKRNFPLGRTNDTVQVRRAHAQRPPLLISRYHRRSESRTVDSPCPAVLQLRPRAVLGVADACVAPHKGPEKRCDRPHFNCAM